MKASPFRSISPKSRGVNDTTAVTKFGQSHNTTSAASLHRDGRDNPFNQVVHVSARDGGGDSTSRTAHAAIRRDDTSNAELISGCSSAARPPHHGGANDPSYFSSFKEGAAPPKEYRTFDGRTGASGDRLSREELSKQPYQSKYGRELSERMEAESRRASEPYGVRVPQSARESGGEKRYNHAGHQSLRDFSRSKSPARNGSEA